MFNNFGTEEDTYAIGLKQKLKDFYSTTNKYTAFHETNLKPEFWEPIKTGIEEILEKSGTCRILEFGAGRTGFGGFCNGIRDRIVFDVQDVTSSNKEYLSECADNVYICELLSIKNKYDIIFSTFVWEHITNPRETIDHLLNLLNPGGSIFIISPRYDFPFYLSPSVKHLPLKERFKIGIWLQWQRILGSVKGHPNFLIHFDPAIFHQAWFRDADAIHWVSYKDLKYHVPESMKLKRIRIPIKGLRGKLWEKFLILFVRIVKP